MQQNSNNIRDIPNELFLANAVHEIRTPVQTIIGTLDLLSDTQMNTEQTEYVRQIRFGAEVLLALVNDILDFSKIKSHKILLENVPYDIKDLVENVVHLISIEAFNKKLEIVTDIDYSLPEMIMGDPTRVQQILINLLKGWPHYEKCQKQCKSDQYLVRRCCLCSNSGSYKMEHNNDSCKRCQHNQNRWC